MVTTVLLFSSCGLWRQTQKRNTTQTFSADSSSTNIRDIQNSSSEKKTLNVSSSVDDWYLVEITPIGEFSFSPDSGFKGKAQNIRWNGNRNIEKQQKEQTLRTEQQKLKDEQKKEWQTKQENKDSTLQQKPFHPAMLLIAFCLVGVVMLGILYQSFIKRA